MKITILDDKDILISQAICETCYETNKKILLNLGLPQPERARCTSTCLICHEKTGFISCRKVPYEKGNH